MERDLIPFISKLFDDNLKPFDALPLSDEDKAELVKLEEKAQAKRGVSRSDFKGVVFDVYGTLILSASGDVEAGRIDESAVRKLFDLCGISIDAGSLAKLGGINELYCDKVNDFLTQAKAAGADYPEIDIVEMWASLLADLKRAGVYRQDLSAADFRKAALVFEILNNPVWPAPGFKEILEFLTQRNFLTGIVSNAQFYTPVMLSYFLGDLSAAEKHQGDLGSHPVQYFNEELSVFSYRLKRGKPSPLLYEELAARLLRQGVSPQEILYVGNDMLKDVFPANQVGFSTALFAGDRRSLRLRQGDSRFAASPENAVPDFIIRSLGEIQDIVQ